MTSEIKKISETFSKGDFAAVYPAMAENIIWNVVGTKTIKGKEAVMAYCDNMLVDMTGSVLTNSNYIAEGDFVAVQGYCNYTNPDNTPGRVEYCDVYRFSNKLLAEITSYCIEIKNT